MRINWLIVPTLLAAAPAHATGGLLCSTAGARPIHLSLGFAHSRGSPLIATRLLDAGRNVPVATGQWWLDNSELRVFLIAPNALEEELVLRARRNGFFYDGSLWRGGKRRWVRCREN